MKKYAGIIFFIMMISLILSGCEFAVQDGEKVNQVSANKTPDTRAFNDDFTRGFMDSPKEVEDGYYLFRSKTNGYTMLFPKEGEIVEMNYDRNNEIYEQINFGIEYEKENSAVDVLLTYENREITSDIEANLHLLSSSEGYKGNYEESESQEIHYYVTDFITENGEGKIPHYNYIGYLKSKKSNQAIHFQSYSRCTDTDKNCTAGSAEFKEKIMKLMMSIQFSES